MIREWSSDVNQKFYSFGYDYKENVTVTEFLSGRVIGERNNERDIKQISCKLKLNKKTGEDVAFWSWYNTMGQTAGKFTCSALGTSTYRFTEKPENAESTQTRVELQLKIEEVY